MASQRQRLARTRKSVGFTQEGLADALGVDRRTIQRWEQGASDPQPWQRPRLAKLLNVSATELDALLVPTDAPLDSRMSPPAELGSGRDEDYAEGIRATSRRLVLLDNELNGLPIAEMAARAFKGVYRRLGEGNYDPQHERDIRAAAAELAEIAGWALFDAERHDAARRFNQEALFLARLAGDRSIELLTLQNTAMVSGWVGRPREELAIARAVLDQGPHSPRVEAIFRVREARGLFALGAESDGWKSFNRAHALLNEGERAGDPSWTWWITESEISAHHGSQLRKTGNWREAIPILLTAYQRGYNDCAASLLSVFCTARSWRDAEELARELVPKVPEISSARTLNLIDQVAQKGEEASGAPSSLRDVLRAIREAVREDPFEL